MKKLLYILGITVAGLTMGSCSSETFDGANGQIPSADDINATVEVDQATNQFTLTLHNPGCYPVWRIYTKKADGMLSTVNGYSEIVALAGTYKVEVQMGNRNGVCHGIKTLEFTIDNTIVDWTPYVTFLNGGEGCTKRWQMAYEEKGHLGCGESGTDGLNWWSAGAGEKAGTGMYEARIEFTDNNAPSGIYTLDPADGGMIFCNWEVRALPYNDYNPNAADEKNDYSVPFEKMSGGYTLSLDGTSLMIELPANTPLPYLPNEDALSNPRYQILSLTRNKMELVVDNGGIAWHYIFVPEGAYDKPEAPKFEGFNYADPNNLWRTAQDADEPVSFYTADNNWSPIANPDLTVDGSSYTLVYNEGPGSSQWQCQFAIYKKDLAVNSATTYDLSVKVYSTNAIPGMTFKMTNNSDDLYFCADRVDVPAYEDFTFYKVEAAGFDAETVKFVFDLAGVPAGTTVTIKDITLIPHELNPGPFPETGEEPAPSVTWVDENSADNLWWNLEPAMEFWWADEGWGQIASPDFEADAAAHVYTLTVNEANGHSQWQGQVKFNTDFALDPSKAYDFKINIYATNDIPGVTIKLTDVTDDGSFLTADRHDVLGYEENVFEFVSLTLPEGKAIPTFQLCLDFGGTPAGTQIVIKNVILQEHRD